MCQVNKLKGKAKKQKEKKGMLSLPKQEEPDSAKSKRKGGNVFDNPVSYQTRVKVRSLPGGKTIGITIVA